MNVYLVILLQVTLKQHPSLYTIEQVKQQDAAKGVLSDDKQAIAVN